MLAVVTWDGGGDGMLWTERFNWSGDQLPGIDDDVEIDVAANPSIVLNSGTQSIQSLYSAEVFTFSGGTLVVSATIQVDNTFNIGDGTLRSATVLAGAGGMGVSITSAATLDGVTLSANTTLRQGSQVTVLNGVTLDGSTVRLERLSTNQVTPLLDVGLNFSGGNQLLGGTGVVELFSALVGSSEERHVQVGPTAGGSLTIGAGVTVRNAANDRTCRT